MPGRHQHGDAFGTALAAADVDGDGKADVAVGAPGEDAATGRVTLLHGHRRGLGRGGGIMLSQDTKGVRDRGERGDAFGADVSLLDIDDNGGPDLVVGAPGEDDADGGVSVILAGGRGLRAVRTSQTVRGGDVGLGDAKDNYSPWFRLGRVIGR